MLEKLKELVQKSLDNAKNANATNNTLAAYYDGQETAYQSVLDMIQELEEKS